MQSEAPQSFAPLGANLGGWLVLEKWQGASGIFDSLGETPHHLDSEWELCEHLGMQECTRRVNSHRDSYMAEADLVRVKSQGFEAVRVPFGYWLIETFPGDMYVGNGTHYLDNVVAWATNQGLRIHLDLHGVPGQQSGQHHSGRSNAGWEPEMLRTDDAARILGKVSERYCKSVNAIEVINEPSWHIPMTQLIEYFQRTYAAIREHGDECTVVFAIFPVERRMDMPSDAFADMINIAFDVHFYQNFDPYWQSMSMTTFLTQARNQRAYDIEVIEETLGPVSIGEWSMAIPGRSWVAPYPLDRDVWRKDAMFDAAKRFYGCTQMHTIAAASLGSFYWSWSASKSVGAWSASDMIDEGFLNTSWRYKDCATFELTASKMDAATTFTFAGLSVFSAVFALIFVCDARRVGLATSEQDTSKAGVACRVFSCLALCTSGFWQWCTLVVRMLDFSVAWVVLPLIPPEFEEEITSSLDGEGNDIDDWFYVILILALMRICIALMGCAAAPATCCLQVMLQYTETDSESISHTKYSCLFSWLSVVLANVVRAVVLLMLFRLVSHTEEGMMWGVGHPLWQFAGAITVANLLFTFAQLFSVKGKSMYRRSVSLCFSLMRVFCMSLFSILGVVLFLLVCFCLLSRSVPWARHVLVFVALALESMFNGNAVKE
jgi:glucan 1,3-beta-glucosidase